MNNYADLVIIIIGAVLAEIGGIGLIKKSNRFPNPSYMMKLGKLACILGVITLILVFVVVIAGDVQ